jgi:hypothetical protein
MHRKKLPITSGFRFSPEDHKLLAQLRDKLSARVDLPQPISQSDIVRMGLRALAIREGVISQG